MTTPSKIHAEVQKTYAEYARTSTSCCGPQNTIYPLEILAGLPADITNFSAGNGDPVTPADLRPGESVLDLGSGGGLDCFLAARQVGETGHVIGVDMTPEMLERARQAARRLGLQNVEFRQGYLEALPVEDNRVDVVISNCVINLSPDKLRVFGEIFRVLKPGGRISVSDTVTNRPVSEEQRKDMEDWCGCTSGALPYAEYIAGLRQAGFVDIQLRPNLALAKQALESGQVQASELIAIDEIMTGLSDFQQCDRSIFLAHLISAKKPA
jgi:SAM-dependent methyltransferase